MHSKSGPTDSFVVKNGLRQGDPLAAQLFNIVLQAIVNRAELDRGGSIYSKMTQILAYADDDVKGEFIKLDVEASRPQSK